MVWNRRKKNPSQRWRLYSWLFLPHAISTQSELQRDVLWHTLQSLLRFIFTVFFSYRAYGMENLPKKGGVLILSNHQSFLDPILLSLLLTRPMSYLAKSELFANPVFGRLIQSLHAYPVDQGRGDLGAIRETVRRLQEGHLLNIFPEGSRTEDGEIGKIERGAALVIRRANVPVLPVAIEGSFQAWPRNRRIPMPHPVKVLYGKPLQIEGLNAEEITDLIDRTLRRMLEELRNKS
jgi:1-acyl-sn-glycerol-3-phosphate acyltransferase